MKNAKTRLLIGVLLAALMVFSLFFTKNGWFFRVLYGYATVMTMLELYSFSCLPGWTPLISAGACIVLMSFIIMTALSPAEILMICLGACLTDACAYLFGSLLHGRFFRSRPFPKTSPNKSWEGVFGGIAGGVLTLLVMYVFCRPARPAVLTAFTILAGPSAVLGDALESRIKRTVGVKDANDFTKTDRFLRLPESLLGGRKGHGGYYDRLDSISLTTVVYFLIRFFISGVYI